MHTTNILDGKVSVVTLLTTRISEVRIQVVVLICTREVEVLWAQIQTAQFVEPTQKAFGSNLHFQFVQINLQDNLVKSWLVSLFQSGIKKQVPEQLWPTYMISNQNMECVFHLAWLLCRVTAPYHYSSRSPPGTFASRWELGTSTLAMSTSSTRTRKSAGRRAPIRNRRKSPRWRHARRSCWTGWRRNESLQLRLRSLPCPHPYRRWSNNDIGRPHGIRDGPNRSRSFPRLSMHCR